MIQSKPQRARYEAIQALILRHPEEFQALHDAARLKHSVRDLDAEREAKKVRLS